MPTVAELVAELLTVEAHAGALDERRKELRGELESRARAQHETEGALPKWSVPRTGTVSWCERKGSLAVVSEEALRLWVEEHYGPAGIVTGVAPHVTNELAKTCVVVDDPDEGRCLITSDGERVPGVRMTPVTQYLSVRLDPEAKARAAAVLGWAGTEVDLGGMAPSPEAELAEERW